MIRSTQMKITDASQATQTREAYLRDDKGRTIAARVHTFTVEYSGDPTGATQGYCEEPGVYLAMQPQALRGGEPFGASQATRLFTSEHALHSAVEKYFRDFMKRAPKIRGARPV